MMRPNIERRQFGRRTTITKAWIVTPGRPRLACVIRNLSPKGAFLELTSTEWLPFQFELVLEGSGRQFVCELRHTLTGGVGVSFCEAERKWAEPDQLPETTEVEKWAGIQRSVLSRHYQPVRSGR